MKILPTLAEVREIASDVNYNVLPVSCEILSDFTTPIEIIKILKKTRKKYCKKTIRNCTIILLPICVYVLYEKILGNLFTVSLGYAVLNIIILEVIYVFSCFCVEIQELQE